MKIWLLIPQAQANCPDTIAGSSIVQLLPNPLFSPSQSEIKEMIAQLVAVVTWCPLTCLILLKSAVVVREIAMLGELKTVLLLLLLMLLLLQLLLLQLLLMLSWMLLTVASKTYVHIW